MTRVARRYSESCSPDPPISFGKSLQAVFRRKHRFGLVDVDARGEPQRWQHGCEDIGQADSGMMVHQVATAHLAVVSLTPWRLLKQADMFHSSGDADCVACPQRARIYRCAGLPATRWAVAVVHARGSPVTSI